MKDEVLRELQLHELTILKAVKEVCEKNGLTYYLDSGTLLGAVRHQGFIPWDDDIDVVMPYDDYQKFLNIAQVELGEDYFVQTTETDPNFYCAFAKVRMNHTTMMPAGHRKYHIHQGIWIDIFPLIRIKKNTFKFKKKLLKLSNSMLMEDYIAANNEEFLQILGPIKYKLYQLLYRLPYGFRYALRKMALRIITSDKKGDYYTYIWTSLIDFLPKELFEGLPTIVSFEGFIFPAVAEYKRYLEALYGDYMQLPPESERKGHGSLIVDFEHSYEQYLR